jgi:hypothetical protein
MRDINNEDAIIHVVSKDFTVEDFIESRISAPGREVTV